MTDNPVVGFEKRTIALTGDLWMCRHFYLQFSMVLDIRYFFILGVDTVWDSEYGFFEKDPKITVMPFRASMILEQKLMLVLCCKHTERQPCDILFFNRGLEWGKEYVDELYVLQYFRHQSHIVLEEKELWIFGAGNNGRYFYEKYKNIFHIGGFISNFEEEQQCQGLPVIRPSAVLQKKDSYVVICSDADEVMAEPLGRLGLKGGRDFSFAELLPIRLFIAVGICQIIKTAETLGMNEEFSLRYHSAFFLENAYESYHDADNRRLKGYGCFCDAVLYNIANAGMTELRNYEPLLDRYYKKAVRFHLPFYTFKGQLPQATDDVNPYALREIKAYAGRHFWFRGDQEINRMAEQGCTEEEILDQILSDDYWSDQEIRENFSREMKKIGLLDRFSSFPVRPFVEEHYQSILIFLDGTHFSGQLCRYLANEIAVALHIPPSGASETENEGENSRTGVMPVYPCVRRVLGINRGDTYQFYDPEHDRMEYLDVKTYAAKYIRYTAGARSIQEELGTIMAY